MNIETAPARLFLAGSWEESPERYALYNPYDGEKLTDVHQATENHLEKAIVAAETSADGYRLLPRHARARICTNIAAGISRRAEEFARLITRESGKPLQFSRGEVQRAIITFNLAGCEAVRSQGESIPLDISAASEKLSAVTQRVPLGPVAAISPFNFPLNLVAHKIAPALAAGCPIILKPAPQTPLTALLLAEVIKAADVPEGVVSILPMAVETAEMMVRDDRLKILSFTGSAKVGWHLKSIAGKKRVLLELGGNAPAIVHHDAELDYAVSRLVQSSFAAAGQVCIKSQRLLIQETIYEEFVSRFVAAAREVITGNPADPATVVGPLIDRKSADRIESWVNDALSQGASKLLGQPRQGNIIPPTVLADVPRESPCYREEIFGPVAVLEKYDTIETAISKANDSRYGLQAGVFSGSARVLELASRDLQFGGVILNDAPMVRVDNYPYGGMKDSGFGREGVRYAMEEFTEPKVIVTRSLI